MSSANQLDTTTIVLLVLGALIVLPLLAMGIGFGGMMGYGGMMGSGGMMGGYGTSVGWWSFVGMLVPVLLLIVLLVGGYLVFRRVSENEASRDPAMEALRSAYARGDLTDDEFDRRRENLEQSE